MKTIGACGRKASMNMHVDGDGRRALVGKQVLMGGPERYCPVCSSC
jgi:thymidine kinase